LGRTTNKTGERKPYVPLDDVLAEVESTLSLGAKPDYVTLSGAGEPTLHSRLGELIPALKRLTNIPIAVLTNGSLLSEPEVRQALAQADVVLPSLDAGDEGIFRYVNRPEASLSFERVVQGLEAFGREYAGQVWLEVFLLDGVTAIEGEAKKIARLVQQIKPMRVQLNTVTRPPAEDYAFAVPAQTMNRLCPLFGERAEVIADYRATHQTTEFAARREDVLGLLRRRPCTLRDIAAGLGLHQNEAAKYVGELLSQGIIVGESMGNKPYYKARTDNRREAPGE
jgi:wyosine [tRNA(Phe)-imidazoG37] synthetase (radical SAM superfamily)